MCAYRVFLQIVLMYTMPESVREVPELVLNHSWNDNSKNWTSSASNGPSASPRSGSPKATSPQRPRNKLRNTKNLSLHIQQFISGSLAVRKRAEKGLNIEEMMPRTAIHGRFAQPDLMKDVPMTAANATFGDLDTLRSCEGIEINDEYDSHRNIFNFNFDHSKQSQPYSRPDSPSMTAPKAPFHLPISRNKTVASLSISIPVEKPSRLGPLSPKIDDDNQPQSSGTSSSLSSSLSESDNSENSSGVTPTSYSDPIDQNSYVPGSNYYYKESESLNCYPDGPVLVCEPNIYLYSEPSAQTASQFDVIINVAKEVKNPFTNNSPDLENISPPAPPKTPTDSEEDLGHPEYIFIPWDHTSKLLPDLERLTDIMQDRSHHGKKVLVHCQCGVSRSPSLVVAYVMKLNKWDLNTAYEFVKSKSPQISPNMTLMYQLMDWSDILRGVTS